MLLLAAQLCFAQDLHDAYAALDTGRVAALHAAAATREDSLLALYRWYALSRDGRLLRGLPDPGEGASARELALLSALWAWRIPGSTPWNVVRHGRRSQSLLDRALRLDAADPLVALIEAQSLLFRPGIAGGDPRLALVRLRELSSRLRARPPCGVPAVEADAWHWYAANKVGDAEAPVLAERLRVRELPPLYRAFVGL